jgi:hypothetical protein
MHGEFRSQIMLNKHYDSVQASVESVGVEFRKDGQITGLLFRPSGSNYPDLIGQWINMGEKYNLAANESILDVNFTKCRGPETVPRNYIWEWQVKDLALIASHRILPWGQGDRSVDITKKRKSVRS